MTSKQTERTSTERPKARILWDREELAQSVLDLAIERTHQAFDLFDHVFVSFSGGKDSTVVLNIALQVAEERGELPLRVITFDEEAIPYETEDYCRRVASDPRIAFEWYCLPVQHRNACSKDNPHWWPWAPEARDLWVRELPPEGITDLAGFVYEPPGDRPSIPQCTGLLAPPLSRGSTAVLMGIRADESLIRRKAVSARRQDNHLVEFPLAGGNITKCYTIYDWRTADVWTAPARFGWDYNRAYDLMEMAGITHSAQRCAPPYGEEPMQKLWTFKTCFPQIWDRMSYRVPGASTAALYARTDLYSFSSTPEKPEDQTWEEFILGRIQQHDPKVAPAIAKRVRQFIRWHYKRAGGDPILEARHPLTGMSWAWLYTLADRGDLKERRWPEYPSESEMAELREAYDAERALHGK